MKCKIHKVYRVKRKPSADCAYCWYMWWVSGGEMSKKDRDDMIQYLWDEICLLHGFTSDLANTADYLNDYMASFGKRVWWK